MKYTVWYSLLNVWYSLLNVLSQGKISMSLLQYHAPQVISFTVSRVKSVVSSTLGKLKKKQHKGFHNTGVMSTTFKT